MSNRSITLRWTVKSAEAADSDQKVEQVKEWVEQRRWWRWEARWRRTTKENRERWSGYDTTQSEEEPDCVGVFCTYSVNVLLLPVPPSLYTTCCMQTDCTVSRPLTRDNLHWNRHRQHLLFYSYPTSSHHNTTTNAAFASLDKNHLFKFTSHSYTHLSPIQHAQAETEKLMLLSCTPSRFVLLFQSLMSYIQHIHP